MASLRLPRDPERSDLAIFWGTGTVAFAVLVAAFGRGTGLGPTWAISAAVLLAGIAGFFGAPGLVERTYRVWNRVAKIYGKVARWTVLRVMNVSVIWLVRSTGSRLPLERPKADGSGWRPRRTLAPAEYDGEGAVQESARAPTGGWARRMTRWASRSEKHWLIALVPFLVLLRSLEVGEKEEPAPRDIYTLY